MIKQAIIFLLAYLLFRYIFSAYRKWKQAQNHLKATHQDFKKESKKHTSHYDVSDGEYEEVS